MSQPARTRFRDSMAVPASLAALALTAVPSAVSHADERTVTVEVAFVDRSEIEHTPKGTRDDAAGLAAASGASPVIDGATPAPVTEFNVVSAPGRPLTVHVDAVNGDRARGLEGFRCHFGNRLDVECNAGDLTVTSTTETAFRLDRAPPGTADANTEVAPATEIEVTIAYQ